MTGSAGKLHSRKNTKPRSLIDLTYTPTFTYVNVLIWHTGTDKYIHMALVTYKLFHFTETGILVFIPTTNEGNFKQCGSYCKTHNDHDDLLCSQMGSEPRHPTWGPLYRDSKELAKRNLNWNMLWKEMIIPITIYGNARSNLKESRNPWCHPRRPIRPYSGFRHQMKPQR